MLRISGNYASNREHHLAGWNVTIDVLQYTAFKLYINSSGMLSEERIADFFEPACDDNAKYNFSELLIEFNKTPHFLSKIIACSDNGYVFKDIRDFIDFVLGARHIDDMFAAHPETKPFCSPAYFDDTRFSIMIDANQAEYLFNRLMVLGKFLNNKYSLSTLKTMLQNRIDEKTIINNIEAYPDAVSMRLRLIFPDKPQRQTVLFIQAEEDHNGAMIILNPYLKNRSIKTNILYNFNMLPLFQLYEKCNLVIRAVKNTDELFESIRITASNSLNNKLSVIINAHGARNSGAGFNGFTLGEFQDRELKFKFGPHTVIPQNALSSLEGGTLIGRPSCSLIKVVSWVSSCWPR